MSRKYYSLSEGLAALGYKPTKPKNEGKKTAQRKKFTKCRQCGGTMIYVPNSNIFICENIVEKKKSYTDAEGVTTEKIVKEPCGNINLVDRAYSGYVDYLFNN